MKRCPVCQRTYPDDAQNFCLEDGATLMSAGTANPYDRRAAPTEMLYPAKPTAPPAAPQPPPQAPFGGFTQERKKSPMPLILGGVGLLVVGIIVTVVLVSNSDKKGASVDVNINGGSPTPYASATPYTSATPAWKTFTGDQYTIDMPGTPTKTEKQQETLVGTVPIIMHTLDKGSDGYVIGYTEYPAGTFSRTDSDTLLDGARDGGVGNVNGKVLSERPISVKGYKGREITGTSTQGFGFTIRLYLADPRLYMLIYLKKGSETTSADGQKFLDSFDITGG